MDADTKTTDADNKIHEVIPKQQIDTPGKTDDSDYRIYQWIVRALDHEAKVQADRIQWAISFTSGLFAASAILITVMVLGTKNNFLATGFLLLVLGGVALVGVVFSLTTIVGVSAAQNQCGYLCQLYNARELVYERDLGLPRPFGDPNAHRFGNLSARVFPVMMLMCWLADLCISWAIGLYMIIGSYRVQLLWA